MKPKQNIKAHIYKADQTQVVTKCNNETQVKEKFQMYRGAGKSLARPGNKQATAAEDFGFIYPIYNHNCRNISTYIYIYIYI
jgi:hypothetical protein